MGETSKKHNFLVMKVTALIYKCGPLTVFYLCECPGEPHVFGCCVAALQQPGPAVHIHQTLVVVIINGRAQHTQV